ncbi:MAG: hypothetical protein NXI04_07180 [Planctomycetaceae bacterium]|nr:hypothetical protein [Planctomycetaceae bacterium]
MDDSKTTFGPSSRFSTLPLPRKIGLAIVVVLLGYGLADPAFLSDADIRAAHKVDEEAALQDFLTHIDGRETFAAVRRATEPEPATGTENGQGSEPPAVTDPSLPNSAPVVQNVSFPQLPESAAAEPNNATTSAAPAGDDMLIVPRPTRAQADSANPRIRLTGTIYPNSL